MKVGEIKLEALSVMNLLTNIRPDYNNIEGYLSDTKYKKYLMNMDEPIKRAIDIISMQNVIKEKSVFINELELTLKESYIFLSLTQIEDFKSIKDIVLIKDKINHIPFDVIANKLIIYSTNVEDIIIVYNPKILLPDNFNNNTEIDMPDHLARIIPYYIKYDLYQEDEPNLSVMAKSQFYTLLDNYSLDEIYTESSIEKIYEV